MLKPAQLYSDQLKKKYVETWYDFRNIYFQSWTGTDQINLSDNNFGKHQFVSVNSEDEVIGYIAYNVDWQSKAADCFGAISFKQSILFARDLKSAIDDIFFKYNLNRLEWGAYVENPAMRGYKHFIESHGGRQCCYKRQYTMLLDGKLHDYVQFEIMSEEYKK